MKKVKQVGRVVWPALLSSVTIALAGCGGGDSGSTTSSMPAAVADSQAGATQASNSTAESSTSTVTTTADTSSSNTTGSSTASSTSTGATGGSTAGTTSSGTTGGSTTGTTNSGTTGGSTTGTTGSGTTSGSTTGTTGSGTTSGSTTGTTGSGATSSSTTGTTSGGTTSGSTTGTASSTSTGATGGSTSGSSNSGTTGGSNTGTTSSGTTSGSTTGSTTNTSAGSSGNSSTATATVASTAATGDNYPRLGMISTGGPQRYASSFQTFAAKFHMVIIGGNYEGWEKGAGYSKEAVIQGIKAQSNVSTRVFQYVEVNSLYNSTYAAENSFPTLFNKVNTMKWWLYPSTTAGTPVADPQNSQRWLLDLGSNVPVDPSTGLGPYEWAAKYVDDLFHLGRYAGTSAAPSLDGFFLDNVLIDPSCGEGNTANGDWSRIGTTQAHNAASTYQNVMTGEKSFYTYLQGAWPGSTQLGNAGTTFGQAVAGAYSASDATLNSQVMAGTATLSGVMEGGDFEHAIGKTYSIEYYGGSLILQQWYQTVMKNFSGSKMVIFSQGNVQANGSDPLTFNSAAQPATYSAPYQGMRYGITAALMNNGYYFADMGVYDEETTANRRWFDEYDNAGAGVGYLGQPVTGAAGSPQTAAWSNGVWMREFTNGVVLWNPKGNGAKTVSVAKLVSPSGHTGLKHINGTQDPAVNNGQAATSVTLQDRDGVILLWTSP